MPIEFRRHTLPNGLTVIAEVDDAAHSAAAGFFVRTGARDEPAPLMGVSHFLEHMMFKGTGDLSADALNRAFDDLGARHNAYTSNEMTCFYAQVVPERLDEAESLLGRMMRPALRDDDFATEKGVILEEIAMYKDNPFWVLYEECVDRYYAPHPLRHRVLGTSETITAMSAADMRGYFERRYSADNTTLALAGRLDFDRCVGLAERLCGQWLRTGATREPTPPSVNAGRFEMRDEKVNRAYLLGLSPGPGAQDERKYAAMMAALVLGGPDNSRLHWSLIETGLAEEAQAAYDAHDGVGEFFVYASCDPERADGVWETVERECAALAESLTDDDLERLRNRLATGVTLSGERPSDRMQRIGRLWTLTGTHRTLEDELDRIERVTLADIRSLLDAFSLRAVMAGRLLPGG